MENPGIARAQSGPGNEDREIGDRASEACTFWGDREERAYP